MISFFLNAMSTLVNTVLAHDIQAASRLEKLEGACIQIEINGFIVYMSFDLGAISLSSDCVCDSVTIIKGPIGAFMHLALAKNPREAGNLGLCIEGDMAIGEALQSLFLNLDIDWEEWLSPWIGDTTAYQVGAVVRSSKQKGKEILNSARKRTGRYIQEDARLVPTATETDLFLQDVDTLRSDVDRLEVRLKMLQAHLIS